MNKEIQEKLKRVKYGLADRKDTQRDICLICLTMPSRECQQPCVAKRESQIIKRRSKIQTQHYPQNGKYVFLPSGSSGMQHHKKLMDIQAETAFDEHHFRQLFESHIIATIQVRRYGRYIRFGKKVMPSVNPTKNRNGHVWTNWLHYQIGSEPVSKTETWNLDKPPKHSRPTCRKTETPKTFRKQYKPFQVPKVFNPTNLKKFVVECD